MKAGFRVPSPGLASSSSRRQNPYLEHNMDHKDEPVSSGGEDYWNSENDEYESESTEQEEKTSDQEKALHELFAGFL